MKSLRFWIVIATLIAKLLVANHAHADESKIDYLKQIKPLLAQKCYACHSALKTKSELRLETRELMLKGGDGGAVVIPGDVEGSPLWQRMTATDDEAMPPEGEGSRLSKDELALVRRWIEQGAAAPKETTPGDPRGHWAFRPPIRAPIPINKNGVSKNPIDAFLAAARSERKLVAVKPASRRILLRRVYLDLIGLPPSREQIDAYLADTSPDDYQKPDAYHKVVEQLLKSPQHGQRWGRHWMDVWRYTDWYGLGAQVRNSQKHIWHWRDWIVESINEDKGYDRMLVEMLAADELTPDNPQALRATGYLARHYYLFNRTTWLDDTIEHTSKAFLGLTMNCAKCHDHKYDPISQVDYYRMRAIFEPYQVRLDAVPGEIDLEKDGVPRVFDAHLDAPTYLFVRGDAKNPDKSRDMKPGVPSVLEFEKLNIIQVSLPASAHHPGTKSFALADQLRIAEGEIRKAQRTIRDAEQHVATSQDNLTKSETNQPDPKPIQNAQLALRVAERTLAACRLRPAVLRTAHAADLSAAQSTPPKNLPGLIAAAAQAARAYELAQAEEKLAIAEQKLAASPAKSKGAATVELKKAEAKLAQAKAALKKPGKKYTPLRASLKAPEGPDETAASRQRPYPKKSTGRRLALAKWFTSRNHPLTARVAVNHIWLRHFGQPLVESITDFGLRSKQPAHHQLLDWLAVELMENNWSMKHLHRLMVTSDAYQLTGSAIGADEATKKADPENHFYWRRQPVRMQSQMLRDSVLHLAGVLDVKLDGPTIDPKQEATNFRRSMYFTHSRDDRGKFLATFDDADILRCYRRSESVVPQQALALANSKLSMSMSRKIAARLQKQIGDADDRQFIEAAFKLLLAIEPNQAEIAVCRNAMDATRSVLDKMSRVEKTTRARENFVHALLNHNDFITIR